MPSVLSRPTQPAHRWILLFDGTASDKDAVAPTNISRLDELVVNDPDGVQITRYSTGVGTGLNCVVQVFGGITGRGLHSKIRKAYDYLARNYREGDELILVGYSRGAFTPLVLSAFLDRIGIPRFRSNAVYRMLWKKFENQELEDPETCRNLRNQFCCVNVPIKLLLAIDAVSAEGSPRTGVLGLMKWTPSRFKKLSFCLKELPRNILRFRHALAIHEYRKPFAAIVVPIAIDNPVDALQVWFPGSHRDLGKGIDVLIWCVAQMSESGVKFDHEAINRIFPGYHTCPDLADPAKFGQWRPADLHPTYKNKYKLTGWQARIPGGKILNGAQTKEAIHIRARYRPFGLTPESQTVIDGHFVQQNYDGRFYWLKRGSWYSNGTWTPKEAPLCESKNRPPVNMGKIPEAEVGQMEAKLSLCLIE